MKLGPRTCDQCDRTFTPDTSDASYPRRYCRAGCFDAAKRKRDRNRKRDLRGNPKPSARVDPGEFIPRDPPQPKVPDIQPRAYALVQDRSAEFVKTILPQIEGNLSMFCFMRGYNELDRLEILKHLRGETRVAPEEIPPDPPVEIEPTLIDLFSD